MPQVHQQKVSFNSGLISSTVVARTDVEKSAAGCRVLENLLPRTSGGVFKRPGSRYLGHTKDSAPAYILPFNYSVDTRLVFELGDGSLRFWKDRERLKVDPSNYSTWSGTTTQYVAGAGVWESDVLYRAKTTHTPSGGNQPPSSSWDTTNVQTWATATGYSVGDFVMVTSVLYVCTSAHTSSATFADDILTKWARVTPESDEWTNGWYYAVGTKLWFTIGGVQKVYRCKKAHFATAANKPTSGSSYATYWEDISAIPNHSTASKVYNEGDVVKDGSLVYVCTTYHTSSSTNEPTDPSSPWKALLIVKPWVASTSYNAGDWICYGGAWFNAQYAFTSGATASTTLLYPISITDWSASPTYSLGDIVVNGTDKGLFICVKDHSTATTTEPGTDGGKPCWQQLGNISVWQTGVNYVAGQYVLASGSGVPCFLCTADHTSGTFTTDYLTNAYWEPADYPLELTTPYTLDEAGEVNTIQVNDQTWLLHPAHEPLLLERFADDAWKLGSVAWEWPPLRDENIDEDHTMTPSAVSGTEVTLTSSKDFFKDSMVGAYMGIAHYRTTSTTKVALNTTDAESSALRLVGRWDVFIYGTAWTGTVTLMFSKDGSTNWQPIRTWDQPVANMRTITANGTTEEEVYAKLVFDRTAGSTNNYAVLEAADSRVNGLVKIKEILSPSECIVEVVRTLADTAATTLWAEGAYSDYRGYPRAGTIHEQRLVLIGSGDEGEKIRMSRNDGFFDFTDSVNDDGALAFQIASRESNALIWAESFGSVLAVGSLAEEWIASSGNEGKVLTPTNPPRVERQTRQGSSSAMPAVLLGDALIFIGNNRQCVNEFSYSFSENKHVAQDLTQLAEFEFSSGIKRIASSRNPERMLFCVMNDGSLMVMTYNREQNVVAWSKHTTDGSFEDVAVIYGGDLNADEVWFVVKRTIDGVDVRYVEAWDKNTARFMFDSEEDLMVYCDSAVTFEVATTTVTGLDHLEGEAVVGIADGVVFNKVVSGGQITLDSSATNIVVGLPFTSKVQGSWLELQLQDGSSQDRRQRAAKASILLFKSNGGDYHPNPEDASLSWVSGGLGNVTDIGERESIDYPVQYPVVNNARHEYQTNLTLRSTVPLPFNVLAAIYTNEYFG